MITRTHLTAAAVLVTAAAVYGSLVPFRYEPLEFSVAVQRFQNLPYLTIGVGHRADWVANILLFVPFGFLWTGAWNLRREDRSSVTPLTIVVAGIALAALIEFAQLWFPNRTTSWNDIAAESIGAVIGVTLWMILGPGLMRWAGEFARGREPDRALSRLLELYVVGFLVYSVMPLDLTLSSGELFDKYRSGRLSLDPLPKFEGGLPAIFGHVSDLIVFIPIGIYFATSRLPRGEGRRSFSSASLLVMIAAAAVELTQVFVVSRFASASDLLVSFAGGLVGVALGRVLRSGANTTTPRPRVQAAWPAAAVAGSAVLLAAVFLFTSEPAPPQSEWRARYEGFWTLPFARYYTGTEFNALSNALRKLLLFGGFGACLAWLAEAFQVVRHAPIATVTGAAALGAGLSFTFEMIQVLRPPHVPDVTDVLLGAIGAAAGAWVFRRVRTA